MKNEGNEITKNDWLTIAAIGVIVFALSSLIHEGFGHGGACWLADCRPLYLSSMNFDGDESMISQTASRFISAGGTLANLIVGAAGFLIFPFIRRFSVQTRYFVWLLATVNLLQALGYLLFSGIGNIGDWAAVVAGFEPWWLWRLVLTAVGFFGYLSAVRFALVFLGDFIGSDKTERIKRARVLMLVPYFTGALLGAVAGLLNPAGIVLVLFSALPATLGGTSGLAWGFQFLRGEKIKVSGDTPLAVARSWAWITAGLVIGAVFVAVLGKGINFKPF